MLLNILVYLISSFNCHFILWVGPLKTNTFAKGLPLPFDKYMKNETIGWDSQCGKMENNVLSYTYI